MTRALILATHLTSNLLFLSDLCFENRLFAAPQSDEVATNEEERSNASVQDRMVKQEVEGEVFYSLATGAAKWDEGYSQYNDISIEYGLSDRLDSYLSFTMLQQYWLEFDSYVHRANVGSVSLGSSYKIPELLNKNLHITLGGGLIAPLGQKGMGMTPRDVEYEGYSSIGYQVSKLFNMLIYLQPSLRYSNIKERRSEVDLRGEEDVVEQKVFALTAKAILASLYLSYKKVGFILDYYQSQGDFEERFVTPFIFYTPQDNMQISLSRPVNLNKEFEDNVVSLNFGYFISKM